MTTKSPSSNNHPQQLSKTSLATEIIGIHTIQIFRHKIALSLAIAILISIKVMPEAFAQRGRGGGGGAGIGGGARVGGGARPSIGSVGGGGARPSPNRPNWDVDPGFSRPSWGLNGNDWHNNWHNNWHNSCINNHHDWYNGCWHVGSIRCCLRRQAWTGQP